MMLERVLYTAIASGVQFLRDNPGTVSAYFQAVGLLEKTEADEIEAYFIKTPPGLIHSYARVDSKFPLYAITLASEDWDTKVVGDEGGFIDDPADPEFGSDQIGAVFAYTYNVLVYAQHPDVCLYYYHLLKQMLLQAFPYLKEQQLFDIILSGADMTPDPAWVPAGLFLRRMTISCKRQYTQTILSSKLGRAWKVQGIYLPTRGHLGDDGEWITVHETFPEG